MQIRAGCDFESNVHNSWPDGCTCRAHQRRSLLRVMIQGSPSIWTRRGIVHGPIGHRCLETWWWTLHTYQPIGFLTKTMLQPVYQKFNDIVFSPKMLQSQNSHKHFQNPASGICSKAKMITPDPRRVLRPPSTFSLEKFKSVMFELAALCLPVNCGASPLADHICRKQRLSVRLSFACVEESCTPR